jgi:hypothetical protein
MRQELETPDWDDHLEKEKTQRTAKPRDIHTGCERVRVWLCACAKAGAHTKAGAHAIKQEMKQLEK